VTAADVGKGVTRVLPIALFLALTAPSTAASGGPWDLRCPSMPLEQPVSQPVRQAALAFWPWAGKGAKLGLRAGPIYLLAASSRTAISRDGDERDTSNEFLHRALVAVAPSYPGKVVITGRRLGRPGPRTGIGFSTDGASRCSVRGNDVLCDYRLRRFARSLAIAGRAGWRIVRTELRIGRTGCFEVTATGNGLHVAIPLSVPGPDWGTSGW
jgi:hypothetical protein